MKESLDEKLRRMEREADEKSKPSIDPGPALRDDPYTGPFAGSEWKPVTGRCLLDDSVIVKPPYLSQHDPYAKLAEELNSAFKQASEGKGKARHADGADFESQKICVISRWIKGSPVASVLFQAIKKSVEAARLSPGAAIHELDGATVYLQAAKILLREEVAKDEG